MSKRMDRISSLPEEIICHIVSFLSAKEAAFASVLSKRWQKLYTIIPNIEFDDTVYESRWSLADLLDVVALPDSTRIRSSSLKRHGGEGPNDLADINRFLCNLVKRGVMELTLDLWDIWSGDEGYSLPFEVFTSKTLVQLEIGSRLRTVLLPENALLPALKTLVIDSVQFSDRCGCAFQRLLSLCPVLVELVMHNVEWEQWEWCRTVSSPTLERLTINHKYCFCHGVFEYDLESITLDTPNLTYLRYFDFAPRSYPIVNLDSLVEASVGLTLAKHQTWSGQYHQGHDNDIITSDINNLIKGLRHVEILKLHDTMTMEAFYCFREAIPVFGKLHHLSVTTEQLSCWRTLPYLLNKSPNLTTLVIHGPLHYDCFSINYDPYSINDDYSHLNYVVKDDEDEDEDKDDEVDYDDVSELFCECLSEYSFLLSCPVKVLEITEYSGTRRELEHMKHFLEKLSCLVLVKVCADKTDEKEKLQLCTNLEYLPRSSKCKIQFQFIAPRSPRRAF